MNHDKKTKAPRQGGKRADAQAGATAPSEPNAVHESKASPALPRPLSERMYPGQLMGSGN